MDFINLPIQRLQHHLSFISTDAFNWSGLVVSFSWAVWAFETYLLLRQYPNYSKTAPPPALASHFTPEVFEKSQKYGKDKARFSLGSTLYRQIVEVGLITYGAYPWSWDAAGRILAWRGYGPEYEIPQSIIFVAIIALMSSIPTLPLSIYQTFWLEAKHGFNKTTPKLFVTDMIKGWVLSFVIGAPFLAAFLSIFRWAGDRFVPWLMSFLITFQLIMVVLYPTVIQPLFNKLSPLEPGELRTRIEGLASRLKFPLTHLYEIDGSKRSSHSNAYFFGLPWSKHIVIFDTLIKQSSPEEVEAVLAHELGHWYYYHPSKMLIVSQLHLLSILAVFPAFLHSPPLLRSFGFAPSVAKQPPTLLAFLLFQMVLSPIESVVAIGMNHLSRKFEWEADAFACEIDEKHPSATGGSVPAAKADMGERLGHALISLHVENLSTVWVDWLFSAYHNSHPTLTERLKALDAYKAKKASAAHKEL